jgi:HEAT repeat protein
VKLRSDPGDVAPLLRPWLTGPDEVTRRAAVEGLALTNVERLARQDLAPDPTLFSALATMLADSSPDVRRRAAVAVGHYADRAALAALTPLVDDDDGSVREQATIAVGWVAEKAEPGAPLRDESVALLTRLAARGEGEAARQASYWLGRVTAKR